jgi:hypothetical protein
MLSGPHQAPFVFPFLNFKKTPFTPTCPVMDSFWWDLKSLEFF